MKVYSKISEPAVLTYTVYIICDKKFNTTVKISYNDLSMNPESKNMSVVYFEKFSDKNKAWRRMNQLSKCSEAKRISIIKKKNPDLLNLIFTISDF